MKKNLFKYCISFGLLAFLIWKIDIRSVSRAISEVDLNAYCTAVLIWCAALAIKTKRWNFFIPTHRFFDLYRYTFISIYYSSVLTGPLVGDGAKAYRLIQRNKEESKTIAASVLLENLTHYTAAPISGLIALLFVSPPYHKKIITCLAVSLIAFVLLFTCGQYVSTRLARKKEQWHLSKYLSVVAMFSDAYKDLGKNHRMLFVSVIYAIPFYFLCAAVNFVVFRGMGLQVNYLDFCWINAVMAVVLIFPVTIAGLGVREFGMASLLALVGLNINQAMAGILVVFSIQIVGAFLGFILDMQYARQQKTALVK